MLYHYHLNLHYFDASSKVEHVFKFYGLHSTTILILYSLGFFFFQSFFFSICNLFWSVHSSKEQTILLQRKADCFQIFSLKQTEKSEGVVHRGLRCEPKAVHQKGTTYLEVMFYPPNTCCYSMIHLLHYKNYQPLPMIPLSKTEAPGRYCVFIMQFFELRQMKSAVQIFMHTTLFACLLSHALHVHIRTHTYYWS